MSSAIIEQVAESTYIERVENVSRAITRVRKLITTCTSTNQIPPGASQALRILLQGRFPNLFEGTGNGAVLKSDTVITDIHSALDVIERAISATTENLHKQQLASMTHP